MFTFERYSDPLYLEAVALCRVLGDEHGASRALKHLASERRQAARRRVLGPRARLS